jgi:DNA-binding protein HU-beta
MNKSHLSKAIATEVDKVNQKQTKEIVDIITNTIKDALAQKYFPQKWNIIINRAPGEKVQLVGFNSWQVKERAARKGRNPQTGETIDIAAKNVVKFKAGKGLIETVNS